MEAKNRIKVLEQTLAAVLKREGKISIGKETRKDLKKEAKKLGIPKTDFLEAMKPVVQIIVDETFEAPKKKD